jgi:hypothetical protein
MGGGIDHATILRPVKCRFFIFHLSLHHQNNHLEIISIFLFAPLQLSSPPKNNSYVEKISEEHLLLMLPPSYAYV